MLARVLLELSALVLLPVIIALAVTCGDWRRGR